MATIRYNTIKNLGTTQPKSNTAAVMLRGFQAGQQMMNAATRNRMMQMRLEQQKENERKAEIHRLTGNIPANFPFGLFHATERPGAQKFLKTKSIEAAKLGALIADNKLDPSSEEYWNAMNQISDIENAIKTYQEEMQTMSSNRTAYTDASNGKGDFEFSSNPENDQLQKIYVTNNLKDGGGYDQEIDYATGKIKYFETILDEESGEMVRVPLMINDKQFGSGNFGDPLYKSRSTELALNKLDRGFLKNFSTNGKVDAETKSIWEGETETIIANLSHNQLRVQVMQDYDLDGGTKGLITREMITGDGFYDANNDGERGDDEMSWKELYNNEDELAKWYITQRHNTVLGEAPGIIKDWKADNPVGPQEPKTTLGDPEHNVQNYFNQSSGFIENRDQELNEIIYQQKQFDENPGIDAIRHPDGSGKIMTREEFVVYGHKRAIELKDQAMIKTKDYLNSQLGYDNAAGGNKIYTMTEAHNQYQAQANAAMVAWTAKAKDFYNEDGVTEKPGQTVDGQTLAQYKAAGPPKFAKDINEWMKNEIGYITSTDGLIHVNPSTNAAIPTSYTPIPELSNYDQISSAEALARFIARKKGTAFNEAAAIEHNLFSTGEDPMI